MLVSRHGSLPPFHFLAPSRLQYPQVSLDAKSCRLFIYSPSPSCSVHFCHLVCVCGAWLRAYKSWLQSRDQGRVREPIKKNGRSLSHPTRWWWFRMAMLADSDCAIDRIHRQSGTRYCSVIVLPQLFSVWVESMNKSHSEMATYLLHNLFCVDFYIVVIPS